MKHSEKTVRLSRRAFLHRGALASVGMGLFPLTSRAQRLSPARAEVRRYVPLGNTGIKMSDISFGASRLGAGEENLVRHAFDRGINYFDTAESYTGGESESTIGNALLGKRDKVYITSKVSSGATESKESLMTTLEGSLRRLRTDYVDVYFNHAVNDVHRLQNPAWYEFIERAKRQGKIRATGMSGHAGRLVRSSPSPRPHRRNPDRRSRLRPARRRKAPAVSLACGSRAGDCLSHGHVQGAALKDQI